MSTQEPAFLEIDHERGVIYVHGTDGRTRVRICSLPTPIPLDAGLIDVTNGIGSSYSPSVNPETEITGRIVHDLSGLPEGTPPGTYHSTVHQIEYGADADGRLQITVRHKVGLDSSETI